MTAWVLSIVLCVAGACVQGEGVRTFTTREQCALAAAAYAAGYADAWRTLVASGPAPQISTACTEKQGA